MLFDRKQYLAEMLRLIPFGRERNGIEMLDLRKLAEKGIGPKTYNKRKTTCRNVNLFQRTLENGIG